MILRTSLVRKQHAYEFVYARTLISKITGLQSLFYAEKLLKLLPSHDSRCIGLAWPGFGGGGLLEWLL